MSCIKPIAPRGEIACSSPPLSTWMNGADPARRHGEAIGGFLDEFGEPIDGCRTRRGLCARARFEERRGRDHAHERRDRHDNARDGSEWHGAVQSRPSTHGYDFSVAGRASAFRLLDEAGKERSETVRRNCNQSREWRMPCMITPRQSTRVLPCRSPRMRAAVQSTDRRASPATASS